MESFWILYTFTRLTFSWKYIFIINLLNIYYNPDAQLNGEAFLIT